MHRQDGKDYWKDGKDYNCIVQSLQIMTMLQRCKRKDNFNRLENVVLSMSSFGLVVQHGREETLSDGCQEGLGLLGLENIL